MAIRRTRNGLQRQRNRAGTWSAAKRAEVCARLAETCNVAASCRAVGMSPAGFYRLRSRDATFRAQCEAAIGEAYLDIELALIERQKKGVRRPVFHAGKRVGTMTQYSDAIALALLRAHRETAARGLDAERLRRAEDARARRLLDETLSDMNRRMGGEG